MQMLRVTDDHSKLLASCNAPCSSIAHLVQVQRLAVAARMVSLCTCPPFAAALSALAAIAWTLACGGGTLVLLLAFCVKSCGACARWRANRLRRESQARNSGSSGSSRGSSGAGNGGSVRFTVRSPGTVPTSKGSTQMTSSATSAAAPSGTLSQPNTTADSRSSCCAACSVSELFSYNRMAAFAAGADKLVRKLPTHKAAKAVNAAATAVFVLVMFALAAAAALGALVMVHVAAVVLLPCTLAYLTAAVVSATKAAAQDRLADALLHNRLPANSDPSAASEIGPTSTNSDNTGESLPASIDLRQNLATASTSSSTTVTRYTFPTPRSPSFASAGNASSSSSLRVLSLDLEVFDMSHGLQDALWPKVPSALDQAYLTWNSDVAKATSAYLIHQSAAATKVETIPTPSPSLPSLQVSEAGLELGSSGVISGDGNGGSNSDSTSTRNISNAELRAPETGFSTKKEAAQQESKLVQWAIQHAALVKPTAPRHPDLRLPQRLVRWGRAGCATACVACFFTPGFALALVASPFAPCLLLPLFAQPRGPLPRHWAPMFAPLAGLLSLVLAAWGLPYVLEAIATVSSSSQDRSAILAFALWLRPDSSPLGWLPAGVAAVCGWASAFLLLRRPALSNCACCAPAWIGAYSLPLALLVGRTKARALLAFSPVPDLALQLPMILVLLAMGVIE